LIEDPESIPTEIEEQLERLRLEVKTLKRLIVSMGGDPDKIIQTDLDNRSS
jgi:hypothetical protein